MKKLIFAAVGVLLLSGGGGGYWLWSAGYLTAEQESHIELPYDAQPSELIVQREIVGLVRQLASAQDQIARGGMDAASRHDDLVAAIARVFDSFTTRDWQNPRNFQAMISYVLSGGRPQVVGKFLAAKVATKSQEALAKGALSFALRRPKTALKQIGELDTRALAQPLVGVVALALASLHATENSQRAIILYDEARLNAPGTAIEEASIRREVPLLLKEGKVQRLKSLLPRYVRVFGKSLFGAGFYKEVARGMASLDEAQSVMLVEQTKDALEPESADIKTGLFLPISRAALLAGKVVLAKRAAEIAIAMSLGPSATLEKAKFYAAAAAAPTEDAVKAVSDLDAIVANDLDADDKAIRNAAKMVAGEIARLGEAGAGIGTSKTAAPGIDTQDESIEALTNKSAGSIHRADSALKNVDALLTAEGKRAIQ